ncbi:uncharacterized protein LOC127856290 isoform X2 [Dreissena polymorpha]|uniref:uncharacterized protein LOC127856290 isoform X2 n=1 Tax=Dreissena polymorpha TaxID=45954 RepID=UPI002264242C|nr:uncharacterized protein LOC127856290 isoform X2 [Dreissena polymorpha]
MDNGERKALCTPVCKAGNIHTKLLWVNCDTWICRQPRLNIECDKFSRVLITNVTSGVNAGFDLLSFDNLRRSCLGLSSCRTSDPQVFCKNHDKSPSLGQSVQFNVSYVCVPESMINKTYENEFQTFRAPSGFIISLNYPTETRYSTFRWKIHVPEGYYVHIFLYDVLTKSDNPITCKGGLHFSSKSTCNLRFPTFPICHTRDWDGVISACSDVDIFLLLDTNNDGIRFWLSYHVVRVEDLSLVSMFKRDHICNLQLLDQFEYRPPEVRNATDATTDAPYDDVIVTSPAGAKDEQADYVTYIGLAVAVLVLLVVIVVAVIYARYRMSAAVSAKDSVMSGLPTSTSQNNCSDIQKRPLPERQSTSEADAVVGLTVQSSYSVVADEVSPECSAGGGNPVYSTYAEIEEFSGDNKDKSKPPLANKRSVDNSKRELPAKPNVYKSIHVEVEDSDVKDAKTEKSSVASKNARNQVNGGAVCGLHVQEETFQCEQHLRRV